LKYPIPATTPALLEQALVMLYARRWSQSAVAAARFVRLLLFGGARSNTKTD
jgi:hypothetical protein